MRRVRSNGEIRWAGRRRFVGEAFVGERIGLRRQRAGEQAVYFGKLLIGHLHERDAGAMRPVVYRPPEGKAKKRKVSPMSCPRALPIPLLPPREERELYFAE